MCHKDLKDKCIGNVRAEILPFWRFIANRNANSQTHDTVIANRTIESQTHDTAIANHTIKSQTHSQTHNPDEERSVLLSLFCLDYTDFLCSLFRENPGWEER